MADTKISALTASTTPLAGTEVLPIVQSGVTKQVSVANLTAGRAVSATQLTLTTGSVIVASGQGVDFSATAGTGTSELFNDYEEGTWTPVDGSGAGLTFATASGYYTKIGRLVTLYFTVEYPATADASAGRIGGLPFTALVDALSPSGGSFSVNTSAVALSVPATLQGTALALASNPATGGSLTNVQLSAAYLRGFISYMA
jgi:hypothetical protein